MRLVNVLLGGAGAVAVTAAAVLAVPGTANAMPIDRCRMDVQQIQDSIGLANYWAGLALVYANQGLYDASLDASAASGWYTQAAITEADDARADGCM